ncbi:MAG: hypothetical protein LBI18_01605, partial [Planctomycetaceae bacterium]|nr:hypothetical protein [Planctomycetaceae bacterium]
MRLNYRLLLTISCVWVLLAIFGVHRPNCCANTPEEPNRKVNELFALGIQAERQEKNTDAERIYEQCLQLAKENHVSQLESPILHRLAILNAKEQKITESEQYFRAALKLDKENITLLCDFAKLYSDQKNYADAETILKNALLLAPNHRRTLFNLGCIIALQKDRQTEGLRYLKFAIGEIAAYQELAKIYRQQGNNSQAEFAEQRATLLQKNQTASPNDPMTSPTVSMDEQTKKELIQHVKEELLRLETVEIAETTTPQQTTTAKIFTPKPEPASTEPVLAKPLPTTSAVAAEPIHDPFPIVEPQKINYSQKNQPTEQPQNQSFAKNNSTSPDPFLTPIVNTIIDTAVAPNEPLSKEININSNISKKLPEVNRPIPVSQELPKQQTLKILKPEPLTNEPVKIFPQNVPHDQNTKDIRTLPATDIRISNSTEGETVIPQQPEIRALTIVPLDDGTTNKSIPEYTAISVRKIPLTGKTSTRSKTAEKKIPDTTNTEKKEEKNKENFSVSRFQQPDSPDSAATISISLRKNQSPQNSASDENNSKTNPTNSDTANPDKIDSDFSARLHLEQPINLITFHSQHSQVQQRQAPVPILDATEKLLKEPPENQDSRFVFNESTQPNSLELENRTTQNNYNNKNNSSDLKNDSVSSQRPSKSILRPGAGKIQIQDDLDSYVYVDTTTPTNKTASDSSKLLETTEKETTQTSIAKTNSPINSRTKSVAETFSLVKPMPGKLAQQLTNLSRSSQPALASPKKTEATTEIITTPTPTITAKIKTIPLPAENIPQPKMSPLESEIDKKSDVQFSSRQAPNVLKFEIASAAKSETSDKLETENESDQPHKTISQELVSAPANSIPVTTNSVADNFVATDLVTANSVQPDSSQQTTDNNFQPPTVLKFEVTQNEIASKPVAAEQVLVEQIPVQPNPVPSIPIQESSPIQASESLSATLPEPVVETKPETTIAAIPDIPMTPAIVATTIPADQAKQTEQIKQTTSTKSEIVPEIISEITSEITPEITPEIVSEIAQPQLPSTPSHETKPITPSDSVAISNPKTVPVIPIPEPISVAIPIQEQIPVQESALPTQPSKPKTEIANNTTPQPTLAHVEAFLPILTVRQPETITAQQPPSVPTPRLNANLKFKTAHEPTVTLPDKPIVAEQTTNQPLEIATHSETLKSETLKFVAPNHPQQKMLPNQET